MRRMVEMWGVRRSIRSCSCLVGSYLEYSSSPFLFHVFLFPRSEVASHVTLQATASEESSVGLWKPSCLHFLAILRISLHATAASVNTATGSASSLDYMTPKVTCPLTPLESKDHAIVGVPQRVQQQIRLTRLALPREPHLMHSVVVKISCIHCMAPGAAA